MTILMPVYLRASYHRHRHYGSEKVAYLCGLLDDAHDGHLQRFSRQGGTSLLRRPLPLQPNPTNPTPGAENPIPMLSSSI